MYTDPSRSHFTQPVWRIFHIPKKNGKTRIIADPGLAHRREMSEIASMVDRQKLRGLYAEAEYAFFPGTGFQHALLAVKSALESYHRKTAKFNWDPCLILLDLRDFFPSVSEKRAKRAALAIFGTKQLGKLACLNGRLSQGHPLSPILANIASAPAKTAISNAAKKVGALTFWYADDLTVIAPNLEVAKQLMVKIRKTLRAQNFTLAEEKIRIRRVANMNKHPVHILGANIWRNPDGDRVHFRTELRRCQKRRIRALSHLIYRYGGDKILNQLKGLLEFRATLRAISHALPAGV